MAGVISFVGLQGSGKSYTSIELGLIPALKLGRIIVTNIPLLLDVITIDYPDADIRFINLDDKDCLDAPVYGAVYLLDELWKIWKNGTQMGKIPQNHLKFLKEHRHMANEQGISIDVFLLTQTLNDLPQAIRDTIERTVICEKILDLGMTSHFKRTHYSGAVKGFKGSSSQIVQIEPSMKYSVDVYKYYKTHMYGDSTQVVEDRLNSVSIFSGARAKIIFIFVIALFLFTAYSYYSFSNSNLLNTKQVKNQVKSNHQFLKKNNKNISAPKKVETLMDKIERFNKLPLSTRWHLSGGFYDAFLNSIFYSDELVFHPDVIYAIVVSDNFNNRRKISFHKNCVVDDFDFICNVDNSKVTFWSGVSEQKNTKGLGVLPFPSDNLGSLPAQKNNVVSSL